MNTKHMVGRELSERLHKAGWTTGEDSLFYHYRIPQWGPSVRHRTPYINHSPSEAFPAYTLGELIMASPEKTDMAYTADEAAGLILHYLEK